MNKSSIKQFLGDLPLTAEVYWLLRQTDKPPVGGFPLKKLQSVLPDWVEQVRAAQQPPTNKRVLVFAMLPYWIEQTTILSLALAGLGHTVTLAYLPYAHWTKPISRFDLRRQSLYMRMMLKPLEALLDLSSLLEVPKAESLPPELADQIHPATYRDVQYSLLREDIDPDSELYQLRLERNQAQAQAMLALMQSQRPDVVILPNGSILEFGITFKVARSLDIPVMTYEFGEQTERMWLAQNADVMRQETDDLWRARGAEPLTAMEWELVKDLFATRQGGGLWKHFSRRWQGTASQGGEAARTALGLDSRPVVLCPTNVFGDSLTLGRYIFSDTMTEWLERTIEYFTPRDDMQLVIRIHPGEALGWGPSVYDHLTQKFPELPEHIHLVAADAEVNTYDLISIADLGLVFTTTVGMEIAMSGLPVIVTGQTHYRGKGFTLDPESWEAYFEFIDGALKNPDQYQLSREQVEAAWRYAYRFFFDYPLPFPWHVQHFWDDIEKWPLERVLSKEGLKMFGDTFRYLVGAPIEWQS